MSRFGKSRVGDKGGADDPMYRVAGIASLVQEFKRQCEELGDAAAHAEIRKLLGRERMVHGNVQFMRDKLHDDLDEMNCGRYRKRGEASA